MSIAAAGNYYTASADAPPVSSRLRGDIRTDICVIGGGYTGLNAALHLARAGARVAVIEARTIGFGASGRNGGQIHSGQRKEQSELEAWLGPAHARALWDLAEEGKSLLRGAITENAIECDLRDGLIDAAHDRASLDALEREQDVLRGRYGYSKTRMLGASDIAREVGTGVYPGGVFDAGGGHLHPLKFARGLAAAAQRSGARLYENAAARSLERDRDRVVIRTDDGRVVSGRAIVACDAFTGELLPELARYIGHVESFITATAPLPDAMGDEIIPCGAAVADTRHVLDYYRKSADGRLLFAGRESYWSVPDDITGLVRPRMLRVFPRLSAVPIEYAWSGTVGITFTRMPHFGHLGERVLFAHGYSGHGVALSAIGGKALAEAMLGSRERFDTFAAVPARAFPGGAMLRRPLITAGLLWYKLMDAL